MEVTREFLIGIGILLAVPLGVVGGKMCREIYDGIMLERELRRHPDPKKFDEYWQPNTIKMG